MPTVIDNPLKAANQRCFDYLVRQLGSRAGDSPWNNDGQNADAFLCAQLPPGLTGVWCFLVSGGPEQSQNYAHGNPGTAFMADGIITGQFLGSDDAYEFLTAVGKALPANQRSNTDKQVGGNVRLMEQTFHPTCADEIHEVRRRDGERMTSQAALVWVARCPVRVVYINNEP